MNRGGVTFRNYERSKEAIKIYSAMKPRLDELWLKLINHNYNAATEFTYQIGFIADIDNCLKKLKIKRNITEQDNVQEIEEKDTEAMLK